MSVFFWRLVLLPTRIMDFIGSLRLTLRWRAQASCLLNEAGSPAFPLLARLRRPRYCAAITKISTRSLSSKVTPMQARCGGLALSTHSSQARFISGLRLMSLM